MCTGFTLGFPGTAKHFYLKKTNMEAEIENKGDVIEYY